MSSSRINIIGCGRLGKTVAAVIKRSNAGIIDSIINTSLESAVRAVNFIGQGTPCERIEDLPPADLYIIATPDDLIQKTCTNLALKNKYIHGKTVMHCSGSLTSDILSSAREKNCHVASVHPIKSFAKPEEAAITFTGTYCGIEGDDPAIECLTSLFEKGGARVFKIDKQQKSIYHVGGVIANNYLVTLHYHALQSYKAAGIDNQTANNIVLGLMSETLNNLKKLEPKNALTGPIQRGDTRTIEKHIQALEEYPITKDLYSTLGHATLPLTQHPESKLVELKTRLRCKGV